jgi:hypothetical protein
MSKSVIIGNNHLVTSLTQNQVNAAAICIGDSHVMQNVKTGVQLINIGFSNEMNSVSPADDSYRIAIGSGNSVRGSSSVVVGTFNNANSTNVLGAINSHYILGNNFDGISCCGSANTLVENSVYVGNALNPGDARMTIGGGLLPIADNVDGIYVSVFNAAFQSIRGVNNPRGTFVRIPSARKYKENITDYDFDVEDFMKLQTVKYNLKGGNGAKKMVGLIADDVNEIDSMKYLVQKNGDEVEGIDFGGFVFPLISVVQQQQKDMLSFKTLLASQAQEINELKNKVDSLISTITNMMKLE